MRFTLEHHAPEGTTLGPDAFTDIVGTEIPLTAEGITVTGLILSAAVAENGRKADIGVELVAAPDGVPHSMAMAAGFQALREAVVDMEMSLLGQQ